MVIGPTDHVLDGLYMYVYIYRSNLVQVNITLNNFHFNNVVVKIL